MHRRNILMSEESILPAGYRQVEYLQSSSWNTARQYINTGIYPNANMRFIVDGQLVGTEVNSAKMIAGSRKSTTAQRFNTLQWQGYFKANIGTSINKNVVKATAGETFHIDFNKDSVHSVTINGETVTNIINDTVYEYEMFVFAVNTGGSLDGQKDALRISRFTVYNNYADNNPAMDLIPCIRISDSKPGMYDIVTNTFFTNAGTGEFITP